ncbi:MAG: dapB [Gammaproteobacteria bacterium]|nr:dapB [Gammaproteobacteria bacterium]
MPIRVLVNGAHGKMGQEAVKAINKDPDLVLAGEAHRDSDLAHMIEAMQAEVVVDLTTASDVFQNTQTIIASNAHPVIVTSGLSLDDVAHFAETCKAKGLGGLVAPNFSIGAVLMMRYASEAAKYFSDVEIIEYHHNQKIDAPSGTAMRTAEMIAEVRARVPEDPTKKEVLSGARGGLYKDIRVHSIRIPGVIANQEVIFGGEGETLTLTHNTLHRGAFMPGICLACKKVPSLKTLVYGLEHLL